MKKKAIIIFLILSYITVTSYAQQKIMVVTHVGKTGFLIKIGDNKIFIDALDKGFTGNYEFPQEVQNKLALAQAPFDNIDLILVTHAHVDYIRPDIVKQHLQNNQKAIFASTELMVNALNDFPDRCVAFNPTKEKPESKIINDITIEAFYLTQEPNAQSTNIGFVLSVNGQTFFQTGDFDTEIY